MKELFSIGPIHIYFFGLMIAVGIISGIFFSSWMGKRKGVNEDTILNAVICVVISGIVGARLFYIIFYNPTYYIANPSEIFSIDEGGLSVHGGIAVALIVGYIYSVKTRVSFLKLADILVVAVALAQGIGRVGCDVFGKVMTKVMPWGINIDGSILHPTQMYEFVLDYLLFVFLWRKSEKQKYQGQILINYIIGFAVIRGIVELFRNNPIIYGAFSISHLLSLLLIIIGIIAYLYLRKNEKYRINESEGTKTSIYMFILIYVVLVTVSSLIYYIVQG
ncbi:prolipoprotein diacylglyceryl transferase [Clostridium paridis]|uniref:Phosphatidylglycerol--prolipoprotein diacylglyceryl transferase n=1 Tax=Clostridium paridis TaxID=2803863 RepID=A0A937K502_9CLOT|nr:prolipoprotein diacylglyceryl transferase [Clostridium paridis]MBL4933821.1 prolipoprotein diacylglyceryl transferase [Clostridium paridis]